MFEGKSILDLFALGGFTMCVLIACSIVSLTVIIQRVWQFRVSGRVRRTRFMADLTGALAKGKPEAIAVCDAHESPLARVARDGITESYDEASAREAMERRITVESSLLERHTGILGTIGGTVVYVGLFGTVLGIINAFKSISLAAAGAAGMSSVISGIAEALICTAAGIAVAVPSVAAFNLLMKKAASLRQEMELTASEVSSRLRSLR